jgi:hypothetical protein
VGSIGLHRRFNFPVLFQPIPPTTRHMVIEWVAISAAVIPHIKRYAADRAEKLASKYSDGLLAGTYRRIVPDEKLVKANEAFVLRFSKELEYVNDLPTLNTPAYEQALQVLLSNQSVQEALHAPLDAQSELDWKLLRGCWNELRTRVGERLIELPSDFDWERLAKAYQQSVRRQMLMDPELRQVMQAVAAIRVAETSERTAVAVSRLATRLGLRYSCDRRAGSGGPTRVSAPPRVMVRYEKPSGTFSSDSGLGAGAGEDRHPDSR